MKKQIQNNVLSCIEAFAEREKDMTENLRKKREKIRHLRDEIDETILRLDTLIGDYYDLT